MANIVPMAFIFKFPANALRQGAQPRLRVQADLEIL